MTTLPSDVPVHYQQEYRKCGKPACKRCSTSKGHGPYWYAYWKEGGKLRSGYVGKVAPQEAQP